MKRIVALCGLIILMMLLSACAQGTVKANKVLNISVDSIESIYANTQMLSTPPSEIKLNENAWQDIIDKLKSFKLKKLPDEDKNGWEYYFRIEQKDGTVIVITTGKNLIRIDGVEYEVVGEEVDFLYLFKKE